MTEQPSVTVGILEASLIPQSSAPTGSQVELIESDLIPDSSGIGSRTLDESFGRALGKTDVSSAHRESKIKLPMVRGERFIGKNGSLCACQKLKVGWVLKSLENSTMPC